MYVAQLKYPGTWPSHPDKDQGLQIQRMFLSIERQLTEAAVALELFERADRESSRMLGEYWDDEQREKDRVRREQFLAGYLRLHRDERTRFGMEEEHKLRTLADADVKREKWAAGAWPLSYVHALPFVPAKSFLHSLSTLSKLIGALSTMDGVPEAVATHKETFDSAFPSLKGVRDSVQHIEARGRGLNRKDKPLNLPGGTLRLEDLVDNKFGTTLDDGSYAQVEVSKQSLVKAQACVQRVIDSFSWTGPESVSPT